jgi:ubiquinone/menaquinone biosynthesis C-methylase UbiE
MDYDATDIAVSYDRGRDHGPEFLDLWMNVVAAHVKDQRTKRILDLGCGTGRFTEALRARFEAEVIGIDPSKKMLEQARSKPHDRRIRYQPGRGESIPVADNSIDLIFMSMIFHHFDNPKWISHANPGTRYSGDCAELRGLRRETSGGSGLQSWLV